MNQPTLSRLGAACGAVFAIVLFVAAGNGNRLLRPAGRRRARRDHPRRAVSRLPDQRAAGGRRSGRLAGLHRVRRGDRRLVLKLGSGAPELAMDKAHLVAGSQLNSGISAIGDGVTVICLYPLAVFCAAIAIVAFRSRALPRWLAIGASITAAGLAVNGVFLGTERFPPCCCSCCGPCSPACTCSAVPGASPCPPARPKRWHAPERPADRRPAHRSRPTARACRCRPASPPAQPEGTVRRSPG